MAELSDLSRISGQSGAGLQLPPLPRLPLPESLKRICPELNDWEKRQEAAETEWVRKAVFNLQQI